jgi:hypothetical protein
MKSTLDCDYTRPGVDPWWECCPSANAEALSAENASAA